jgi:hypothetical protein
MLVPTSTLQAEAIMATKLVRTDWETFSRKFVSFQRLPNGTELRLFHADGRKARVDKKFTRSPVSASSTQRLDDGERVTALHDEARRLLATDLKSQKLVLRLHAPDGKEQKGGTLIRTVRKLPPAPTPQQVEQQEQEAQLQAQLEEGADAALAELEYLVEDPAVVCRAMVAALVKRYGRKAVVRDLGR